ncbi:MAG TPA: carbohydrate porin, partial [Terriglobia bacterium]|nr:carbohydrate porin [Terriglobia bacterium]
FQVSHVANAIRLDWNILHAWSWVGELEKRHSFGGHHGAVRLLAYEERGHLGSYQESLGDPQNISANGQLGFRTKYGFGINAEQEIRKDLGAFFRLGWNDGRNQTWEFTDVDRTASGGISLKGGAWRRPGDTVALAAMVNGISAVHRQFLANGGLGVTVGDGRLDYGTEKILETYYSFATRWNVWVTPDFQFVANPAYNRARGPASILALRFHWEK